MTDSTEGDSRNRGADLHTQIEEWIGVGAIALLGFACFLILLPFLTAALWAAILCFTTWPLFSQLRTRLGDRRTLAALLATLLISACVLVPVAILVSRISANMAEITAAAHKLIHEGPPPPPPWIVSIPVVGVRFASWWQLMSESSSDRIAQIAGWLPTLQRIVLGSGRALGEGVFQIILSLLMVFLFYRDGETVVERVTETVSRIGGSEGGRLLEVAGTTIRAVVYGVLGTALLQGALAGFGFLIAGVPGAALLGFITFVVAVIPGGPLVVAAPGAFWLYRRGSAPWAVFVVVWALIVGNLDSVVRPILISRGGSAIPMILVILGVLGGAMVFGLIGLFLGPTFLAVGYSLFNEWSKPGLQSTASQGTSSRP
jgi:predicted PurR-regulated permease PerM